MKTGNRGFTLVELIVVIAIIGVLVGLVGFSSSSVSSARAKQCSESIDTLISKCRTGSLSRAGNVKLVLSIYDGYLVSEYSERYEDGTVKVLKTDKFSAHGVSITYTLKRSSGTETTVPLKDNPLTLSFDRETGAQKPQMDGSSYCTGISFAGGSTHSITLVPSTGSHGLV